MSAFVGIDIAKNSFDIASPLHNGKFRTKAKLPNDPKGYQVLQTWLETHSEPEPGWSWRPRASIT